MDHIISAIVIEAFEKAKAGSSSQKPTALSNFIEEKTDGRINSRTARRAYKRYIDQDENVGAPIPETVKNFCNFLGYDDFEAYVIKNENKGIKKEESKATAETDITHSTKSPEKTYPDTGLKKSKGNLPVKIIVALGTLLVLYLFVSTIWNQTAKNKSALHACMAWAKDHFEKVTDCDLLVHPEYGTKVERLVPERMQNMRKVEVNAATDFFSEETNKPLIWYYKDTNGDLEYFTSPGLHPVHGETLKKITPGMIQKYVPIHTMNKDSFIENNTPIKK